MDFDQILDCASTEKFVRHYLIFGCRVQLSRYSDSLRAGRSGDRIPVWGRDFPAPVQTGSGAHPASCTMGPGSFLGDKATWAVFVGPCHHGTARPQVADGGTPSDKEGSCEYIE
jgi:hypothetical protein